MRLLYVVKGIGINGITKVMFTYYDNLDKSSYHIDFVSGSDYIQDYREKVEKDGNSFWVIENRDTNIVSYIKRLSEIIKRGNYDIVHVHGNSTMIFPELLAAKRGGCTVRIAHSHSSFGNHPKLVPLCRPLFNMLYTHGLACSPDAGKWMFKNRKFGIINNGIDTEKFRFNSESRLYWRKVLCVEEDELLLGNVATMTYVKNHKFMIEILSELRKQGRKVKLLFVGDGELLEENRQYAYEKGVADYSIFFGSTDKVQELMAAMDVFLFPSFFEGLGIVLIEAQASGLPCFVNSSIPRTADINNKLSLLSIDDISDWVGLLYRFEVVDRDKESNENILGIKRNEYDIESCIEKLKVFYKTVVNE